MSNRQKLRMVTSIMKFRAEMMGCSYRTAWNQYMTDREKQGFSFESVISYVYSQHTIHV